jgi:transcriptional regulator with XRE-family HTH domain
VGTTALGQYLRARRELVHPGDASRATAGRRRVPGLRREELAMLAGISVDYYLRLEQGRDNHPSAQVIDTLARALQLDDDATAHMHSLSQPAAFRARRAEPERAPNSLEQLIASWPMTPAYVQGRHMDVLAANALALALTPVLRAGVNLVRATFLDPEVRRLVGDWDKVARRAVARLHALAGPDVEDPRLVALVGELSARSQDFRRLWARHDIEVAAAPAPARTFHHPLAGSFELELERLAVTGRDRQFLFAFHAQPGSRSEQAVAFLAGISADEHSRHA